MYKLSLEVLETASVKQSSQPQHYWRLPRRILGGWEAGCSACSGLCSASPASLPPSHQKTRPCPRPRVTTKQGSRHCQMSPGWAEGEEVVNLHRASSTGGNPLKSLGWKSPCKLRSRWEHIGSSINIISVENLGPVRNLHFFSSLIPVLSNIFSKIHLFRACLPISLSGHPVTMS